MVFFKKSKKPTRLKNVKVKNISILVDDVRPCNDQPVIVKDDDGGFQIQAKVVKFEPEGFLVVRPIISDSVDYDDEFYTEEDVINASYDTIKGIQKNGGMLFDVNHDFESRDNIYYVETYITKDDTGKTIWEMKLDIRDNEEMMLKAKEGKINGVSIAGTADKVTKSIFEESLNSIMSKSKEDVKKDFDSVMQDRANNDTWAPLMALETAIWNAEDKYLWETNDPDAFKKEVKKVCSQFVKHINGMTFERITKSEKPDVGDEGEDMTKEEIQELVKGTVVSEIKDFFSSDEFAKSIQAAISAQNAEELDTNPSEDELAKAKAEEEEKKELNEKLSKALSRIEDLEKQVAGDAGSPNNGDDHQTVKRIKISREERAAGSVI